MGLGETDSTSVSELLRDEIEKRDISQREAAEAMGVTQAAVQRWVSGESLPARDNVAAVARFLKKSQAEVKAMLTLARRDRCTQPTLDDLYSLQRDQFETVRRIEQTMAQVADTLGQLVDAIERLAGRVDESRVIE
jgi:transcriptional regulator with XRE-family HTH domain